MVIDMDGDIGHYRSKVMHMDEVEKTRTRMLSENDTYSISELFKVFGDPTRIKLLSALAETEMCVYDMAFLLDMTQSAVSHQLRVLKQARLVRYRKEGKVVFYMLDDNHVKEILDTGLVHVRENKQTG
jgi:ArsR family transcriptional regulator, lead/cadmium/zinc/bismuth-responsive transcriptional repressor